MFLLFSSCTMASVRAPTAGEWLPPPRAPPAAGRRPSVSPARGRWCRVVERAVLSCGRPRSLQPRRRHAYYTAVILTQYDVSRQTRVAKNASRHDSASIATCPANTPRQLHDDARSAPCAQLSAGSSKAVVWVTSLFQKCRTVYLKVVNVHSLGASQSFAPPSSPSTPQRPSGSAQTSQSSACLSDWRHKHRRYYVVCTRTPVARARPRV